MIKRVSLLTDPHKIENKPQLGGKQLSAAFRQPAVFLFYGQVWTSKHAVVFYPFAVTRKSEVFSTL
jgi:hypothetical protein